MAGQSILMVEGKDDEMVLKRILEDYKIAGIEVKNNQSISTLKTNIGVQIKGLIDKEGFRSIGIIVDADQDVRAAYDSIKNRCAKKGFDLPKHPVQNGTIIVKDSFAIGVWLMPNNQLKGNLEDFIALLISSHDKIEPEVRTFLENLKLKNLARYNTGDASKAFLYTWLAVQKDPGKTLSHAFLKKYLVDNHPNMINFIAWLQKLAPPPIP